MTHEEQRLVLGLSASEGSVTHAGLTQITELRERWDENRAGF